jgi:dolichyl-phosphate beta-glucosyltransferase
MPTKTIIVIPCYNEAARLQPQYFLRFLNHQPDVELFFVNDGSSDETPTILEHINAKACGKCTLLHLNQNQGKSEAVRFGIIKAFKFQPEYIGYWDADLSTPLESIPVFVQLLENQPELEMVFGARVQLLGKIIERNPLRHYLGRLFATIVSIMLDLKVYDTQCGAKLFRANDAIHRIFDKKFISRWIFDVEIIARWQDLHKKLGLPPSQKVIFEYPLPVWRHVNDSKVSLQDVVSVIRDLIKIQKRHFYPISGGK